MTILPRNPNWFFDDIIIGRTYEFGACSISKDDIEIFHNLFAPNMEEKPAEAGFEHRGSRVAESHIYALWRQMLYDETRSWPILRRLGQDNLRFYRTCYAGDELHVRMCFLATEDRDDSCGVMVASHEVLDADELLVMSVLTRTLVAKRPK